MNVPRETCERLELLVDAIRAWQPAVNLVSPSTLDHIWTRHIEDCWQIVMLAPTAATWLDLGSGAGLPGLVIAAAAHEPSVTLVESDGRKCAFLRHAARRMGVQVQVVEARIETYLSEPRRADAVTARGLADLARLIGYAQHPLSNGAVGLFPKGRTFDAELTSARESWTFTADVIPSRTDPHGRILRISDFRGRKA